MPNPIYQDGPAVEFPLGVPAVYAAEQVKLTIKIYIEGDGWLLRSATDIFLGGVDVNPDRSAPENLVLDSAGHLLGKMLQITSNVSKIYPDGEVSNYPRVRLTINLKAGEQALAEFSAESDQGSVASFDALLKFNRQV
jgi:hypothetical protein